MTWQPHSYGGGKRHWWLENDETGNPHLSSKGNIVWYSSYQTAMYAAERLEAK